MPNLTNEELKTLQSSVKELNSLKIKLGETILHQQGIMNKIASLREDSSKQEELLINKYGEDSVINIETGEVKPSENK
jgi:hypothetical protein